MSKRQTEVIELIKSMSGQAAVLTIPRLYLKLTGNDHALALFLSQCVYYSDISTVGGGWFAKSCAEWLDEVGLTRAQVDRCAEWCIERKLIEYKIKKFSNAPTGHYKPDMQQISNWICDFLTNGNETKLQLDLQESDKSITEITTETSTEETTKTSLAAIAATTTPTPATRKRKSSPSEAHPNTQPIMQAFVECLPEALRMTFDYRANGKWAKVLAQIEVLKPAHIKTYYAQMRTQWNKSPKMRDQAITFYALYQYILAAAQNSNLAELEPPAAQFERAIERVTGLDADERAELQDEQAQERAEAAPDPAADAWARVAEYMREAKLDAHTRYAEPVELRDGVLTVGVTNPDWLTDRAARATATVAQRAGLVAVRWVARVGGGV